VTGLLPVPAPAAGDPEGVCDPLVRVATGLGRAAGDPDDGCEAGDPEDGREALVRVVTGAPDEPPVLPDDPAEEATVPPEDPAGAACDPLVRVATGAPAVPPEPTVETAVERPAWDRLEPVRTALIGREAGRLALPCRPVACPAF
jgi:hypothetical protein